VNLRSKVRSLLYLRTAQQGGAWKYSTIVASIRKVDHRIHEFGQEANSDNLPAA